MSLQVWLPLTKDLRNQGISDLTFSLVSTNTAINDAGKLGKCYTNNSYTAGGILSNKIINLGQRQSMFCWFKFIDLTSSSSLGGGLVSQHRYAANQGMGITIKYVTSTTGYLSVNTGTGSDRTYNRYCGTTLLQANTWYHGGYTYDNGILKIYVNGNCEYTGDIGTMFVPADYITVFCWSMSGSDGNGVYGSYKLHGFLNDIRIYDHCLSEKEVKEISKGLVLHYPLNRNGLGVVNLVKNGFGELNTENWENSNIYTDVPSSDTTIKKSYKSNSTIEYIPIYRNQTYTFSTWVKADQSTGYSYPSLWPYDVDKKFIHNYHCKNGFNLNTMTTLSRQLNPGDTKVYVNDLSQWNANSGHYYNWAAIFGYEDSTGYTYPDGVYTQNTLRFATSTTEKTNLDKTNNIITLLSAYNGPIIPVGTSVCASTEGSTYFYPVGGIANSTIADWTFKTGSFSSEDNRLANARYVRIYAYSLCYQAGITLKNSTIDNIDNSIEYDISGYCNNGTRTGSFSWTDDTPKYQVSTTINSSKIQCITNPITGDDPIFSIGFWFKLKSNISYIIYADLVSFSSSSYSNQPFRLEICGNPVGNDIYWFRGPTGNTGGFKINTSSLVRDIWYHTTLVSEGNKQYSYYINGIKIGSYNGSANSWIPTNIFSIGDGQEGAFNISDVRIYATALSAEDILELYQQKGYANSFEGNNLIYYEYIQNNDLTQYIDLQTSLVNKTVEVKFQQTPLANSVNTIYGGEDDGTPWYAYGFRFNSSTVYMYLNGNLDTTGVNNSITTPAPDENIHIFRGIHKINQKSSATLDGEALPVVETIPNKFSARTAFLFATKGLGNPGGIKNSNLNLRIYYFKIWDENDNLTHYLRPCSYNGHTGMWNEIDNTFYPNCGKGEFTCGNIEEY